MIFFIIKQNCQVIEALGSSGVEWAECLLTNGQGALVVGPGSGVVALGLQQEAQVIKALGSIGVGGTRLYNVGLKYRIGTR